MCSVRRPHYALKVGGIQTLSNPSVPSRALFLSRGAMVSVDWQACQRRHRTDFAAFFGAKRSARRSFSFASLRSTARRPTQPAPALVSPARCGIPRQHVSGLVEIRGNQVVPSRATPGLRAVTRMTSRRPHRQPSSTVAECRRCRHMLRLNTYSAVPTRLAGASSRIGFGGDASDCCRRPRGRFRWNRPRVVVATTRLLRLIT